MKILWVLAVVPLVCLGASVEHQPVPASPREETNAQPADDAEAAARQSAQPGQLLNNAAQAVGGAVTNLITLPQTIFENVFQRNPQKRLIGERCQTTADCVLGTTNSVCYNDTCLCNLGFRYNKESRTCQPENLKYGSTGLKPVMLASPEWPENYPAGIDAYYCLKASGGKRVNLNFIWMDLETNRGFHNGDYIAVYNGCVAKKENLLGFYLGDTVRPHECVTSSCNEMLVHFHSDPEDADNPFDQRSGFMGHFVEVPYESAPCAPTDHN
ncbi:unnamed protein product [Darwinula stevensoni]|uniref:CUB domain-containing protein n=1 Tax=Darwinula stevensoni TaxID=69355 RepID=A0A7R8XFZ3_9CRUS|nr:unnamed protein product [Darwinula stevensoni]CAG0890990.1 unnamed protein product [Darwinula stevensoni]